MPPMVCPDLMNSGSCTTVDCAFNHTTFSCDLCKIICPSQAVLENHIRGKKHRKAVNGTNGWKRCVVCDVVTPANRTFALHEAGARHRERVAELRSRGEAIPPAEAASQPSSMRCPSCDKDIAHDVWNAHVTGQTHIRKLRFAAYKEALEEGSRDKFGVIVVQDQLDFGLIDKDSLASAPTRRKTFHIIPRERDIELTDVRMSSSLGTYSRFKQVSFSVSFFSSITIAKGKTFEVAVTFNPQGNLGEYDDRVEFVFEDFRGSRFAITRVTLAAVAYVADQAVLAAIAPYVPPVPIQDEPEVTNVMEGEAPPQLARVKWVKSMPPNDVPQAITELLKTGSVGSQLRNVKAEFMPRTFTLNTYSKRWTVLLWLEEAQATKDLRNYDQNGVAFAGINVPYHYLAVPGLAEKRPSVIVSDTIRVQNHKSPSDHWWRGHVHKVEQVQVGLVFHKSFHSHRGQKFDVRFELNRLTYKRMYQALGQGSFEERILFPKRTHVGSSKMQKPTPSIMEDYTPMDRQVATNPPQWLAVTAIAELKPGSIPFVIFGPPGTGKTVTLIEAMRQILATHPDARILACAPSNSAADILAERLSRVMGRSELFRLVAPSRGSDTLPMALQDFVLKNNEGTFSIPPPAQLKRYRVVVSTCFSASVPYGIGVERGHFTHVFVDEAGQASEPELMIPVKLNSGPNTNVIIAGDPKQLGPIIRSPIAERLGLDVSWLDRLMASPLYDPQVNSGVTVVKLIKNWRSHPAILKFPNEEFYRGDLEAHGNPVVVESCMRWWQLPTEGFPIIFHSIKGKDQRQASSPSFFNPMEASVVRDYVRDLKGDGGLRMTDSLIGVISPYNAQCQKIRTLLKPQNPGIKVGSVEEFQGQERRVMIVSTVRSSMDYVEFDLRHTLGFVSNPRRFNVAMTRAQALLIVVGDPDVLGLDPLWRRFLNYIHKNGGWKGRKISWDPDDDSDDEGGAFDARKRSEAEKEMDEMIERTKALILGEGKALDDEDEDDAVVRRMEATAERPWREDQ